jgi:hypothetical protein
MTIRLRKTLPFLAVIVLVAASCPPISAAEPEAANSPEKSPPKTQWHWPKVVISKETTYFTGPLRPDGGVDYVAALNRRYSEGVTSENNAAVAIWQALGSSRIDRELRKQCFGQLGIPELPEKGDYLIEAWDMPEFKELARQYPKGEVAFRDIVWAQFFKATETSWSKEEYPLWAAALERNHKPLKLLAEGLTRPRFYWPLVPRDGQSEIVGRLVGNEGRCTAWFLSLQAMFQSQDRNVSDKWQDVMALYRLERLLSQAPLVVDWIMAARTSNFARRAAVIVSQNRNITAAQAKDCQRQLCDLPAMRPLWKSYDVGNRCYSIEMMMMFAATKDAANHFDMLDPGGEKGRERVDAFRRLIVDDELDWSEFLRCHNAGHDRLVAAWKCPTIAKTFAALTELETKARQRANSTADFLLAKRPDGVERLAPKVKAQCLANLMMLPSVFASRPVARVEQQRQAYENLAILAFALAGYRADHDEYPRGLAQLTPTYIDAIPQDPFTDGDLRYRAENGGYLLYSVGPNGKDDDGFGGEHVPDSATEEQRMAWPRPRPWDDLSIRTPPKKTESQ